MRAPLFGETPLLLKIIGSREPGLLTLCGPDDPTASIVGSVNPVRGEITTPFEIGVSSPQPRGRRRLRFRVVRKRVLFRVREGFPESRSATRARLTGRSCRFSGRGGESGFGGRGGRSRARTAGSSRWIPCAPGGRQRCSGRW